MSTDKPRRFAVGLLQKYLTVLDIHLNLNMYVQVCTYIYIYIMIMICEYMYIDSDRCI